jgi:hypothetical protein
MKSSMLGRLARWLYGPSLSEEEIAIRDLIRSDEELSRLFAQTKVPAYVHECPPGSRACYHIPSKEIWISPSNWERATLRDVLLHEYIHAYDHVVAGIDIATLRGLSITEIHAAMRSECRTAFCHKSCTRSVAIQAVATASGNEKAAQQIVPEVFEETYRRYSSPRDDPYPPFFAFNSPYD